MAVSWQFKDFKNFNNRISINYKLIETTVRSLFEKNQPNYMKTRDLTLLFRKNNVYLYRIVCYILSLNLLQGQENRRYIYVK